jgi:hypothetical protein
MPPGFWVLGSTPHYQRPGSNEPRACAPGATSVPRSPFLATLRLADHPSIYALRHPQHGRPKRVGGYIGEILLRQARRANAQSCARSFVDPKIQERRPPLYGSKKGFGPGAMKSRSRISKRLANVSAQGGILFQFVIKSAVDVSIATWRFLPQSPLS